MKHFGFLLGMICLLSASISLIFALVIFTLRRNAGLLQKKRWAMPFAATFFVLAEIYFLRFCNVLIADHLRGEGWLVLSRVLDVIVLTSSGVTNYLLFLSGFRLLAPAVDKPPLLSVRRWLSGRDYLQHVALSGLCLTGLMQVFDKWDIGPRWLRVATNIPDAILSMLVLLFMGYVLHLSISSRSDKLMARIALASAVAYGVLYLFYGLGVINHLVASGLPGQQVANAPQVADLLTFALSLLLKFGLFFPGYSLMLSAAGPLECIEEFYEDFTQREKEYLESGGIVKSIREELKVNKVSLDIKLPGIQEAEVAHSSYPSTTNGPGSQEPQKFKYKEGTPYDRVMTTGEPYVCHRDESPYKFFRRMTEVTVPLIFHNSVIASLKAEIGDKRFTETDLSNLKRITTMVSPAVQGYREMAALNKLSQDLARLQIGVEVYEMGRDLGEIIKKLQNVISASASGISIEIGFDAYRSTHPQTGPLAKLVNEQLDAALNEEDVQDDQGNYRWLRKELKIPTGVAGEDAGEQVFSKFVFGTEKQGARKQHATMGTNHIFRRALADLVINTLLDFVRGYLNQLTDQLGVELSRLQEDTPERWLGVVEKKAQEARLLWAAAKFADDDELFGQDKMDGQLVELINRLEDAGTRKRWQQNDDSLCLYSLEQPAGKTCHVIRKVLAESKAVLWLGVSRPDFGPELYYVSPWKYFLDHFCAIADSALYRIRMKFQDSRQRIYIESLQMLSAANIATGGVKHNLVGLARSLKTSLETLNKEVDYGHLRGTDHNMELIRSLRPTCNELEKYLNMISEALNRNKSLVCSLDEAIAKVCDKLEEPFKRLRVRIVRPEPQNAVVRVPMYAAIVAIDTVLDNARGAILEKRNGQTDEGLEEGLITINVINRPNADEVICDITDNGPGVPPELQKKLFKEPVTGTRSDSHGVGSFFSALTLRGFNGDILLKHPEPGATIRIKFPKPSPEK